MSRCVLDDTDLSRAEEAVLDHVARLLALEDSPRFFSRYGSLVESLVSVRIKLFTRGIE